MVWSCNEEGYAVRRVLDVEIAGVVGKSPPRLEWMHVVENNLQRMGSQCSDVLDIHM
jgi:hypothetical protein